MAVSRYNCRDQSELYGAKRLQFGLHQIPNIISIFRILLVGPIVYTLLLKEYEMGLVLFAVAGWSDGLDGFLAKHYGWQSWLGSILDPIADKLLLVASFVALGWLGVLPLWLVALVILRDVVIVAGATIYYFNVGHFTGSPSFLSKFNTVMQIILVLVVVLHEAYDLLPHYALVALIAVVALTTVASGLGYVVKWGKKAHRHGSH